MSKKVAVFWPGDYRPSPNKLAVPEMNEATAQMVAALKKLGRKPYVIRKFLTKPSDAIENLTPIDDPMVGVFVHWTYGPHVVDGVVGKENPLLLASNFSGTWPGLVALLNTAACLEVVGRKSSRIWTSAKTWTRDKKFMERLDEWCNSGRIQYPENELYYSATISKKANDVATEVLQEIKDRRILLLMLGDTSMGMINGYFGAMMLPKIRFTEHKVDQAWLIDRVKRIKQDRVEKAFKFVVEKGVKFHWREKGAEDFTEDSTKEQLKMYLAVLDLVDEFKADCVGWQYQLGLIPLMPPSDFSEGLLNTACRPEGDGDTIVCSTEADQGNAIPMELMKRILKKKGMHQATAFHDVRWGGTHAGRFLWVLLNSGSCSGYFFNKNAKSLKGVHSYRQPKQYFPFPGGTFTGESMPGGITWARSYIKGGELWMDVGRGESVKLPPKKRDYLWEGTDRAWPFMAGDLGVSQQTIMAHYMSNHVALCYGDIFEEMVALCQALGFRVRVLSGSSKVGK